MAPRRGECLQQQLHLALEPTGFEALVSKRILSGLSPPIQPQDGIGRSADGKQDEAGDLDGG